MSHRRLRLRPLRRRGHTPEPLAAFGRSWRACSGHCAPESPSQSRGSNPLAAGVGGYGRCGNSLHSKDLRNRDTGWRTG